ncbi:MAG: YpfJ protein, zinc metalloprotease superfamily [uncultured Thermomicrobiales bacterium]|uniref:YpfJ protein, zinc metalloprotease superfamily n=1 Tax=uncultured Thermomicrobiales bacterium TaxID=1645740 RepID=A0A6J4VPF9_9BACT|nr:MAG: YpfJ protein, zinc metalloprotease superfamily [uncultured Thermomicrobiales bacterium]
MSRPVLLLLTLALAASALVAVPRPLVAQGPEQDPAETAVALSALEAAGDFNALYDRIHPDAHAVVPRAAVIGWFQNAFAPRGPGVSTVTDVRVVAWTWPVTGRTYPTTAEVSYEQPFADGTVEEGVVRLVLDEAGEWRWFFGRDRAFVDEQIARYVPAAPESTGSVPATTVEVSAADLDAFWREAFAAEPERYVAPAVLPFDQVTFTGCGAADASFGPFYCPLDRTIYLEERFLTGAETAIGDFAAAFVVAHEWGHHVQHLRGFRSSEVPTAFGDLYSIEFELMADCYAGVWTQDADTRGILESGDVEEAVVLALQLGDASGTSPYDPSAHGTNAQRANAFLDGYLNGISACEVATGGVLAAPRRTAPAADLQPASVSSEVRPLVDLLPTVDELPPGLEVAEDLQRSRSEVTASYADPVETERLFTAWGWRGNAARRFSPAADARLASTATTAVYVSLHRFGDAASTAAALDYSVKDQLTTVAGAREITVGPVSDQARAMRADDPDGVAATTYAQRGDLLVRVTAKRPVGDPLPDALAVARAVVVAAS